MEPQIGAQNAEVDPHHYPPTTNNRFADTLFSIRQSCDLNLRKIIQVSHQNKCLQNEIDTFQASMPPLLIKLWKENKSLENITTALDGLDCTLQQEIDVLNKKMNQHRGEYEVLEADYEEELRESDHLKRQIQESEDELAHLKEENQFQTEQYQLMRRAGPQLNKEYFNLLQYHQILKHDVELRTHYSNFIDSYFKDQVPESKQLSYKNSEKWLKEHITARKQNLEGKLQDIKLKIDQFNAEIREHERENEQKQEITLQIVRQKQKVQILEQQLLQVQKARKEAEQKKDDLQQKITEEMMEKAISQYDKILEQYKRLALQSTELVRQSIRSSKLEQIENVLHSHL